MGINCSDARTVVCGLGARQSGVPRWPGTGGRRPGHAGLGPFGGVATVRFPTRGAVVAASAPGRRSGTRRGDHHAATPPRRVDSVIAFTTASVPRCSPRERVGSRWARSAIPGEPGLPDRPARRARPGVTFVDAPVSGSRARPISKPAAPPGLRPRNAASTAGARVVDLSPARP